MDVDGLIEKAGGLDQLAEQLGVARTTVSDWKRLGFLPGSRIPQIMDVLGVKPDDVLPLVKGRKPRERAA